MPTRGDEDAAPVRAGGTPSKGTPKDKRLKENKSKVTKAGNVQTQRNTRITYG